MLYEYIEKTVNINMKRICSRTQENGLNAEIIDNKYLKHLFQNNYTS